MLFWGLRMEFKDKIMLYCFMKVKCRQGFTTEIWYYLLKALGLADSMCISGLMVSESEFRYDNSGSFSGRRGYKFTF